jgi:diazepam-binding inhibitor (GABA receptor modulating acyl-CoA-binding protein)
MAQSEQFKLSAEIVKGLKTQPTNDELLLLYGLYKQGTIGNCQSPEPIMLFYKEKSKWAAWMKQKGKDKNTAQSEYCNLVLKLIEKYGLVN